MSSPEIQRRLRQQGADIESLNELVTTVDEKIDALGAQAEASFAAVTERTSAMDANTSIRPRSHRQLCARRALLPAADRNMRKRTYVGAQAIHPGRIDTPYNEHAHSYRHRRC